MNKPEILKLSVAKGDVLVVLHGDPESKWIPSAEEAGAFDARLRAALDEAGHQDVPVVSHHFGVQLSTLNELAEEAKKL